MQRRQQGWTIEWFGKCYYHPSIHSSIFNSLFLLNSVFLWSPEPQRAGWHPGQVPSSLQCHNERKTTIRSLSHTFRPFSVPNSPTRKVRARNWTHNLLTVWWNAIVHQGNLFLVSIKLVSKFKTNKQTNRSYVLTKTLRASSQAIG